MKTEIKNKIEEALQAIAQLRDDYPLDTSAFTRQDELEVYEIEVLNEGKIYGDRKAWVLFLVRATLNGNTNQTCLQLVFEVASAISSLFNRVKSVKNPRIGLHAALNHMEQQLQEFLINGLYDELEERFQ